METTIIDVLKQLDPQQPAAVQSIRSTCKSEVNAVYRRRRLPGSFRYYNLGLMQIQGLPAHYQDLSSSPVLNFRAAEKDPASLQNGIHSWPPTTLWNLHATPPSWEYPILRRLSHLLQDTLRGAKGLGYVVQGLGFRFCCFETSWLLRFLQGA